MVKVKCEYINIPRKSGDDYFIYTDILVEGHADKTGYTNNTKVCAGISACCYGIRRLLNDNQFHVEYRSGYYHVFTNITKDIKTRLDKESVYALNTLVCQLFEIYHQYPSSFKSFDLIDVKENYENGKINERNTKPFRSGRRKHMGIYSLIEGEDTQEN